VSVQCGWADPIKLSAHSSIDLHQNIEVTVTEREDEAQHLHFADSSDSLGPVTLSNILCTGGCAEATITSFVQPSSIRVTGSTTSTAFAEVFPPPAFPVVSVTDFGSATAEFATSFTLTNTHSFESVLTRSEGATVELAEASRGVLFSGRDFEALMGTLAAGDYTLSITLGAGAFASVTRFGGPSSSSDFDSSDIDLSFTLAPVAATPEPATAALFATGLIGLTIRKRRSRANRAR